MELAPVPWPECHPSVFWQCSYFAILMTTHYFGSIDMAITMLPSKRSSFKNKSQDQEFFSSEYTLNHSDKFQNYLLG